jgi:NDP-sugar pyrophosphorylase family protein
MLILIPMAGFGDRYKRAGYTEPKPLIPVDGVPMIERVISAFLPRQPGDRYVFVVNRTHAEETNLVEVTKRLVPDAEIVIIEPHKDGPIQTMLAAKEHIRPDEDVLLNYCDFGVDWSYPEFRAWLEKNQWDGAMSGYRGFHPHSLGPTLYAYMRVAEDQETVLEIREKHHFTKDKLSEYASSGLYYFRRGDVMLDVAREMLERGERVQGEFYVSMAQQALVERGLKVGVFPLRHFYQWGTPDDLRDWEAWSRAMREIDGFVEEVAKTELRASTVVPMAGLGQRFRDRGYTEPKPFVPVAGRPMVEQVLRMLPGSPARILVALNEHAKDPRLTKIADEGKSTFILGIPALTSGQATTALRAVEVIPDGEPVLFAPCDTGCLFDVKELARIEAESEADLVVLTAKGHLPALFRPQMYGWVRVQKGMATSIAVKKQIEGVDPHDQEVVLGTFWFASKASFVREYEAMVADKDTVNGEYYIDTMARRMVEQGAKVRALTVQKYVPWGTPEELDTFHYWNDVHRGGRPL